MSQILDLLYEMIPNLDEMLWGIGFIVLLLGIAEAFLGYKLFIKIMGIIGFLAGGLLGLFVFVYVHGFQESNGVRIYMLIGAVIGAAAANFFYRLSVFLGVFAGSFFFFFLLIQNTTVSLILGVICGMIGVIIDKYCIIVTTGLSGGKLAAMGIWMIEISEGNYGNVGLIGWLIGIGGIIFQIWLETRCPAEEGDPGISGIDIWGIILIPCFLIAAAGKWIYNHIKNMQDVSRQKNRYEDNSSYVNGSFSLPSKQDFCVHCGAKMSDTARFCSKCGTARRL